MTLYSYSLRLDSGAAPNPYWGVCTLVICKPAIRRTAEVGDWIVGLGSKDSPLGDKHKHVVCAMKISKKMTLADYDKYCRKYLPNKIPDTGNGEYARRVGDCIYDYSGSGSPRLRRSVHDERNRKSDLDGKNALLSDFFWYFGNKPIKLSKDLLPITHPHPGHKSKSNIDHVGRFEEWIAECGFEHNTLNGEPQLRDKIMQLTNCSGHCAVADEESNANDEIEAMPSQDCSNC